MAEVRLINVTKRFDRVQAVRQMNLDIADQEFLVMVGPSGCGKTTTLRMIAGLETITEGEIYLDDRLINDVAPRHRDVAVVFQNYALYPHMTVFNNMAYGLKRRKFPAEEIAKRVKEAAEILDITDLLERLPKQLSGGQQQRVALGRAIVRQPAAFLFDEPLSALDAKLRVQMRAELVKLHAALQSTMIYVTHDQVEAMTMGDRIVVMRDGIMQQVGTPKEIYHTPANEFVAGFVGSPPMNFIPCRVESEGDQLWLVAPGLRLPASPEQRSTLQSLGINQVTVGIRPEDLHCEPVPGSEHFPQSKLLVEVVEPLGFENHLSLSTGHQSVIARVSPRVEPRAGDYIEVMFDANKLHLFDSRSGERLAAQETATALGK